MIEVVMVLSFAVILLAYCFAMTTTTVNDKI